MPRCDVWLAKGLNADEELKEAGSVAGVDFVARGHIDMPAGAFDPSRNQYDVQKLFISNKGMSLLITDKDMFVSNLNFVFGLSDPSTERAVVSIARLMTEDRKLFHSRLVKEIAHEIGHCFGLRHCRQPCVMAFSPDISGVDGKNKAFCAKCRVILDASKPH